MADQTLRQGNEFGLPQAVLDELLRRGYTLRKSMLSANVEVVEVFRPDGTLAVKAQRTLQ